MLTTLLVFIGPIAASINHLEVPLLTTLLSSNSIPGTLLRDDRSREIFGVTENAFQGRWSDWLKALKTHPRA
jgi:hypothetical protein